MGINKYDCCMLSVRDFFLVKMIYVILRIVRFLLKGLMFCLWNFNNNKWFIVVMIFKFILNEYL